jgi:hypothetical protein
MIRTIYKSAFGLSVVALSALASAAPTFRNTGEDLSIGQVDSHWTVEKVQGSTAFFSPGNSYVMNDTVFPVVGAYEHLGYSDSKWISFTTDGYCNSDDIFKFTQRFWIDSGGGGTIIIPDSAGYRLTGKFSSDNASEMYLNGNLITSLPYYEPVQGYSWQATKEFNITSGFVTGWNEVSYLVGSASTMGGNEGPMVEWMALRVEGEFQAVPEPATMAMIGLGFATLVRRKRVKG